MVSNAEDGSVRQRRDFFHGDHKHAREAVEARRGVCRLKREPAAAGWFVVDTQFLQMLDTIMKMYYIYDSDMDGRITLTELKEVCTCVCVYMCVHECVCASSAFVDSALSAPSCCY